MSSLTAFAVDYLPRTKDRIVLDRGHLHSMTDGDVEFERELVDTYIASARSLLGAIRSYLLARDAEAVAREAHGLKGASLNFGARSMAKCAMELETSARSGNLPKLDEALEQLRVEEQALWTELEHYAH